MKLKKDPISQIVFLDEAMKVSLSFHHAYNPRNAPQVLESKPSTTFWGALARALEKQTRDGAKSKMFPNTTGGPEASS